MGCPVCKNVFHDEEEHYKLEARNKVYDALEELEELVNCSGDIEKEKFIKLRGELEIVLSHAKEYIK